MAEHSKSNQSATGGMSSSTKTPANSDLGQNKPGIFDAEGAIGKQFTDRGVVGEKAQKIGGPFDKEGLIGKHFTEEGSIGGTMQNVAGGKSKPTT